MWKNLIYVWRIAFIFEKYTKFVTKFVALKCKSQVTLKLNANYIFHYSNHLFRFGGKGRTNWEETALKEVMNITIEWCPFFPHINISENPEPGGFSEPVQGKTNGRRHVKPAASYSVFRNLQNLPTGNASREAVANGIYFINIFPAQKAEWEMLLMKKV